MHHTHHTQPSSRLTPDAPRAAWVGLIGSIAIAAGRLAWLADADDKQATWWTARIRATLGENTAGPLTVLGACLLLLAWMLLRTELGRPRRLAITFVCWVLPLLPLGGIMSSDPRYYADIGWSINHGHDPYSTGLGTTGSPFPVGPTWHGTFAVYPALALRLFGWVVAASGSDWYWSVVAMRALALAGVALLALSLPVLADQAGVDRRFVLWLGVFNPVTMLHGIGGAHIDMLMVGMTAAALALAVRYRSLIIGALAVGVAAAIKQPALLAAVPVALLTAPVTQRTWPRTIVRTAASVALAIASLVAVSWLTGFGMGWLRAADTTYSIHTVGVGYLIGEAVRMGATALGLPTSAAFVDVANTVVGALGYLLIVVLYFRYRHRPWQFLASAALTWAIANGAFREWYLIYWLAFVALADLGPWMRRAVSVLVPFAMAYSAFKSYLGWNIMPATYLCAAIALAANARGWLLEAQDSGQRPMGTDDTATLTDADPEPKAEPAPESEPAEAIAAQRPLESS